MAKHDNIHDFSLNKNKQYLLKPPLEIYSIQLYYTMKTIDINSEMALHACMNGFDA